MYHGGESKKKTNPKEKANILSRITFFFTRDLLSKGYKNDIDESDIYEVIPQFRSAKLGDTLQKKWDQEKSNHSDPSIWRVLWATYGRFYLTWGLIQLCVKTSIVMIQPRALGKLISYFTSQTTVTRQDAFYYAGLVIGLNVFSCTYAHNYQLILTELGIRVRTAFCSLIYRKSLKLNPTSLSDITVGKIVTLITKDVNSFDSAIIFLNDMWISVIQIMITTYLIYTRLGVATFAGIGFLILVIPLQIYVGKLTSSFRIKASKETDHRLQVTQETLSAMKIIKMYTWEKLFGETISKSRNNEIRRIKKIYYAKAASLVVGGLVLNIALYIIVITYTKLGNYFTAEVAFFLLSCLQSLRSSVTISIPLGIAQTAELAASIKRIHNLLNAKELLKRRRDTNAMTPLILLEDVTVKIKNTTILHNINLKLGSGLHFITGKVGGGKSSLLKTILEDYPIIQGQLKIHGDISYASEDPWLFPSTIKQNILFGQGFDRQRYRKVLEVCSLNMDLDNLELGDDTIVDDGGMNLSKGQQARIALARAVYKDCDIYLLDDCLSSLDTHVQESVFKECVKKFLKDKIVVMISHNQSHITEGDNIIIMKMGTIKSSVKPSEIPIEVMEEIVGNEEIKEPDLIDNIKIDENENNEDSESSKLIESNIYKEKKQQGKVSSDVYKKYCKFGGGFVIFIGIFVLFFVAQFATSFTEKLVSKWVNIQQNISDYQSRNMTDSPKYDELLENNSYVLTMYTVGILISTILVLVRAYAHFRFSSQASVNLHQSMISAVLNATMKFFDLHYIGNILNRFSKDLGTIDEYIPFIMYECLRLVCTLVGIIILIATVNISFLFPAAVVLVCLYFIRRYYLPTGRSLKRLDSATRSPVIGHLNASLDGITTIRAYGIQKILENEFDKHQDRYTSAFYMLQCSSRAFAYVLDMLCNVFIAVIVIRFLVFDIDTQAGNVGLAITQAFMLTGLLQWGIRQWAELENQMTSVERVLEYSDIKEENKSGQELKDWPREGAIAYKNVCLTYGNSKEYVLKHIDFTIEPKEKIGVVGRTGAGKSSIISTLFRMYQYEGTIFIDDVDIRSLSLTFLRSTIAIIPQDPILFSGTIRSNIDPTLKFKDEEIWAAIKIVKLEDTVRTLDDKIMENGANFSSGQKQLLCLARAIVGRNKIIVLDEATANMDPETDAIIHKTIQESFADCTVITIAHRLHSVMDSDKIMVIDKGEIVEFDIPKVLLRTNNENGIFYKMVKQANLLPE